MSIRHDILKGIYKRSKTKYHSITTRLHALDQKLIIEVIRVWAKPSAPAHLYHMRLNPNLPHRPSILLSRCPLISGAGDYIKLFPVCVRARAYKKSFGGLRQEHASGSEYCDAI
jgi:hypothetical protein